MQHIKPPNQYTKNQHQHRPKTRQNNPTNNPNETINKHPRRRSQNTKRADKT